MIQEVSGWDWLARFANIVAILLGGAALWIARKTLILQAQQERRVQDGHTSVVLNRADGLSRRLEHYWRNAFLWSDTFPTEDLVQSWEAAIAQDLASATAFLEVAASIDVPTALHAEVVAERLYDIRSLLLMTRVNGNNCVWHRNDPPDIVMLGWREDRKVLIATVDAALAALKALEELFPAASRLVEGVPRATAFNALTSLFKQQGSDTAPKHIAAHEAYVAEKRTDVRPTP